MCHGYIFYGASSIPCLMQLPFFLHFHRQSSTGNSESTASLSAFACHVLREICSQQWVLERCLCHPEELCHNDNLLDPLLSHSQAQRLLHMICYPDASSTIDELDQKSMITRILEVLLEFYVGRGRFV